MIFPILRISVLNNVCNSLVPPLGHRALLLSFHLDSIPTNRYLTTNKNLISSLFSSFSSIKSNQHLYKKVYIQK